MLQPRRTYAKYTWLVLKINWCNLSQPQGRESYYTKIKKALDKNSIPMHTKSSQQTSNSVKKWAEDLNRHPIREDIQMVNKHMKRQTSYVIRELQIKTTVIPVNTLMRMAKIPETDNTKCW